MRFDNFESAMKETEMPTMSDVARQAGVALSTVSYAINGTRPISAETRDRIFAAMDELGYRPNALARGLASKRSRIIALLLPISERGIGTTELEFVTSAADAARDSGYNLVLWTSTMSDPKELRELAQQGLADAVVVMEVHMNDERIDTLLDIGFPFTVIGRSANTGSLGYVDIDFERTMQEVVQHLAALGHSQIAFLNHSQAEYDAGYGPAVRAHHSFAAITESLGLTGVARFCRSSPRAGYEAFDALLHDQPDVTGLILMNDRAIPGVLQAITDREWRIPEDFSLVSMVTSGRIAEMTIPPLTMAEAPSAELGRLSVELLIQQLEGEAQPSAPTLIPCQLVARGSSGPNSRRTNR